MSMFDTHTLSYTVYVTYNSITVETEDATRDARRPSSRRTSRHVSRHVDPSAVASRPARSSAAPPPARLHRLHRSGRGRAFERARRVTRSSGVRAQGSVRSAGLVHTTALSAERRLPYSRAGLGHRRVKPPRGTTRTPPFHPLPQTRRLAGARRRCRPWFEQLPPRIGMARRLLGREQQQVV